MQEILLYLFKSSACIAIFWLVYRLFFCKETFFRFIRYYLLSGIIASLVIPMLHFTYEVKVKSGYSPELLHPMNEVHSDVTDTGYYLWGILGIIYFTGVLLLIAKRVLDYRKFYRILKGGIKTDEKGYSLIESTDVCTPFSMMKYIVVNPTGISTTMEKDIILKHEISHIRQKHWLDLIACEVIAILQWFNPLAWKYVDALKENHEYMVDKDLLDSGIPIVTYREVLVNQIFGRPVFTFSNSFIYSKNSKRLFMMSKTKSSVWKKALLLALLPLFSVFVWASAEPKQVEENAQNKVMVIGSRNMETPVYIVDGKEYTAAQVENIPPAQIESMHVYKGKDAIEKYGDKGKNGVIDIKMKPGTVSRSVVTSGVGSALIIVDGKIFTSDEFNALNPETIESIKVIKDDTKKSYGEAGKNGVLEVRTKKHK